MVEVRKELWNFLRDLNFILNQKLLKSLRLELLNLEHEANLCVLFNLLLHLNMCIMYLLHDLINPHVFHLILLIENSRLLHIIITLNFQIP